MQYYYNYYYGIINFLFYLQVLEIDRMSQRYLKRFADKLKNMERNENNTLEETDVNQRKEGNGAILENTVEGEKTITQTSESIQNSRSNDPNDIVEDNETRKRKRQNGMICSGNEGDNSMVQEINRVDLEVNEPLINSSSDGTNDIIDSSQEIPTEGSAPDIISTEGNGKRKRTTTPNSPTRENNQKQMKVCTNNSEKHALNNKEIPREAIRKSCRVSLRVHLKRLNVIKTPQNVLNRSQNTHISTLTLNADTDIPVTVNKSRYIFF